ncbi:hypothetical protein NE237_031687 [Protea cynaroides]|uniref:Glabrous enhancer-binding protein-like DBD domain-containing protein n=1 Tax=Protea cynaroides TaxID=273540 RepID=A0A9Q0R2T9_9MAGN|nr:hypothetical protein NE237_031687 [Protea cynaroides]
MPPKRPSLLEEPPTASSSSEEEEDEEEQEGEDRGGEEQEEEDDDEEGEEDDDEEGEEDDDEEENATSPSSGDKRPSSVKKPPVMDVPPTTPSAQSGLDPQSSDDEDDEESGTDSSSDSEPSPEDPARLSRSADPNIKPISSKPMDYGSKSKMPAAKASASPAPSAPPAKFEAAAKRPLGSDKDGSKDNKRRKEKHSDGEDDEEDAGISQDAEKKPGDYRKKQLFQRLWTEDDELAILKGMLDYYSKKGTDPSADMNAFHDFIKKSFHIEFTRIQLTDKIRRLRKKYQNNVGRGKDPVFSKPHEHKAFELSKKIWGAYTANDVVGGQTVSNGKLVNKSRKTKNAVGSQSEAMQTSLEVRKVAVKDEKEIDWSMYPHLAETFLTQKEGCMMHMPKLEDSFVKEGACLVGSSTLKELEQKWRNLRMTELDLFFKRMELMREQVKLFQDACNPKK